MQFELMNESLLAVELRSTGLLTTDVHCLLSDKSE